MRTFAGEVITPSAIFASLSIRRTFFPFELVIASKVFLHLFASFESLGSFGSLDFFPLRCFKVFTVFYPDP